MNRKPTPMGGKAGKTRDPQSSVVRSPWSVVSLFSLIFGLFLGLCFVKFGNPVILDAKIVVPRTFSDVLSEMWPTYWARWILFPLLILGAVLAIRKRFRWPGSRWLWLLPAVWFGWQFLSATHSVDANLTSIVLWQFGGCVGCFLVGALVLNRERALQFLLFGLLAAFVFCLIRAVDQKLFEFPRERQFLLESQRAGWTNLPPDMFADLKQDGVVIRTNGLDVINPMILAKYDKGRVHGTLVYPNALAGAVLMLWPMALVSVWLATRQLRPLTHRAACGLIFVLGAAALFWSGSKSGWLIAIGIGVLWLWRLNWSPRLKRAVVIAVIALGLIAFGVRFHSYFAKGATSVSARFDYWRAAVTVTRENPVFGSGPGTFQRPYARLKSPEAEMARLTHNDYLEQFSDSGIIGGLSYAAWIAVTLWAIGRRVWRAGDWLAFAIFSGLLGWFAQGFLEFSLYVPALAWTAFTLAGCLVASPREEPANT